MKKIEMEKQAKAFGFAAMKFMETKDLEFEHEIIMPVHRFAEHRRKWSKR